MVRVQFCFSNLVDDDTAHITADFLCHHVSSLKMQRNKLNKSKELAFLSQLFLCNKKLVVVVFLMVVMVMLVLLLCQLTFELLMLLTTTLLR